MQCGHAGQKGDSHPGQDGAGQCEIFIMLLRTSHLKLMNYFQNFPFNNFGLGCNEPQKIKPWVRGTTVFMFLYIHFLTLVSHCLGSKCFHNILGIKSIFVN